MKKLSIKKKDAHILVPSDEKGNFELYLPPGTIDPKDLPEQVEIGGSGKNAQKFYVNISAPVKHRHKINGQLPDDTKDIRTQGNRIMGDHDRLLVMTEELYQSISEQIDNEQEDQSGPA